MATALIILAAGQGTRMNSDLPKVLHKVAGAPVLAHAMRAGATLEPERMIVVTGHEGEAVSKAAREVDETVVTVTQDQQLGTGHAVAQALPALEGFKGKVLILFGDTPLIRTETLEALAGSATDITVLGFEPANPRRYGRLILSGDLLERIVEAKDATEAERAVTLCNGGLMAVEAELLSDLVTGLSNDNAAGEYYLTEIVALARAKGRSASVVTCGEGETLGVDTRAQLAQAEASFQARARAEAQENGVTMTAPETVFFAYDTVIGRDTVIAPNVVFGPGVTVESEAEIRAFCHLEGCHISRGATVGPFARLRPGAELAEDVHVGNFVEIKNAILDEGVKVGHLTYLGDAHIGEHTNIGAGTITCNYDGVMKHRTEIGKRAFIGSDTMLVAPVKVGDGALTASGSVITQDVPAEALAISRAKQETKPGLATKLFEKLKQIKAKRQKEAQ
ncbi:bifunctional UDP-N-acetylglucosamine diphosphorylase/glucosamine-1-phosphate N-acetyltransferase GlmU [Defluviimonas aestuarii]|uniref:bifunctional UDP-N-acetylglucosamine diphosphorylase/glucosamine-1-phosphate N-acetyltransferase GlmU n=1 Tax=Albidovulum aestuarii TaxID=1130726 RepID=UPI00249C9380|nr:bifunctional UDP-N-acetylglucosamine diphosphorylase/glucosamine-1-phosphate N-acetyltransferase GlmU [Defluviimonas aestuarii]MDI3335043.1 bifunctional UDP-N-acetylglucosamine diphosphorylase/glucosamine-1-phosphate N-acetyltransferase GlmU [Defluviimonas aestuarii]